MEDFTEKQQHEITSMNATKTACRRRRIHSKLKDCPFCHTTDHLEILTLTTERLDGTEYIGAAVKCNRCEALAPRRVWQG